MGRMGEKPRKPMKGDHNGRKIMESIDQRMHASFAM